MLFIRIHFLTFLINIFSSLFFFSSRTFHISLFFPYQIPIANSHKFIHPTPNTWYYIPALWTNPKKKIKFQNKNPTRCVWCTVYVPKGNENVYRRIKTRVSRQNFWFYCLKYMAKHRPESFSTVWMGHARFNSNTIVPKKFSSPENNDRHCYI